MIKSLKKKFTFIDLFAGCGGLSLGLEQSGFFPLFVNEINQNALDSYLINRKKIFPHLSNKYFSKDIKDIIKNKNFFRDLFKNFKEDFNRDFKKNTVDLIVGGPPCQGFSGIGHRRSYSVSKSQLPSNHLYQDMAYFIHNIKPKIFLFENVRGLLSSKWTKNGKKGEIFQNVLDTFKNIPNYNIKYKLIFSKDFGVPQNRPRVFIVGINKKIKKDRDKDLDAIRTGFFPENTSDYPDIKAVFSDLIDNKFKYGSSTKKYKHKPKNDWQKNIRTNFYEGTIFKKGDKLTEHKYSNHSEKVRKRFKFMIENNGQAPKSFKTKKFNQKVLPVRWGKKGPSITVCSMPDDFIHYKQPRSLTVREYARLQTFPDWYQFCGSRTTGGLRRAGNPKKNIFEREVPRYTQIGNSVPVKLAFEIGKHFIKILSKTKK